MCSFRRKDRPNAGQKHSPGTVFPLLRRIAMPTSQECRRETVEPSRNHGEINNHRHKPSCVGTCYLSTQTAHPGRPVANDRLLAEAAL
jgi:hypothetical protein